MSTDPRLWVEYADAIEDIPLVWNDEAGVFDAAPLKVYRSRPVLRVHVVTEEMIRTFDALSTAGLSL